jgi:hypothetical protein
MLRAHSQQNGRKLIDLADAVVHSHRLLVTQTPSPKVERLDRLGSTGEAGTTWPRTCRCIRRASRRRSSAEAP